MTGREAPFPLRMTGSCSKWKRFLEAVFRLVLTEFKSQKHRPFHFVDAKAEEPVDVCSDPSFPRKLYDSKEPPSHPVRVGETLPR